MQTAGQPRLDRPECQQSEEGALRPFEQCSEDGETTTGVCAAGYVCMKKNDYYGQCLRQDDVADGWDGSIIARALCSVRTPTGDSCGGFALAITALALGGTRPCGMFLEQLPCVEFV